MNRVAKLARNIWVKRFLFLLGTGLSLGLSSSPRQYYRVLKDLPKDWERFKRADLYRLTRTLKRQGMIKYTKNKHNDVNIQISDKGRRYLERLEFEDLSLPTQPRWDEKWRLILFDIPEVRRRGRDSLRRKLKELGCYELQKSVFAWPYDCRKEINLILKFFSIEAFVKYAEANIDEDLKLKNHFNLR